MKEKSCIFVSAIFFLGCSPLEQAPLVYSSTATFGVSTGVNTTETLGFDIVLGYRQADAAYVPVAVAKKTDDCSAKENEGAPVCAIMPIAASKSDLRTKSKTIPEEVKNNYNQLQTDIGRLKTKITEQQASKKLKEDELSKHSDSPESAPRQKLQQDVKELSLSLDDNRSSLDLKTTELRTIKEEYGIGEFAEDGSKKDAYSVYGSFESNSSWFFEREKSTVGNGLGKVFSTGVAAQTLTEAELIKSSYECFEKAEKMSSDTAKEKLFNLCATLVEKQINKTGQ